MNDGGWAHQLGGHACPRHKAHLCRHFPHRLRRLGAASTRSRWKAALVDRRCWFSAMGAIFWKMNRQLAAAGPGGAADAQEPSAEGSRPARIRVTTRANNVKKRGSSAIIFTAFPFGTCTPEGTPVAYSGGTTFFAKVRLSYVPTTRTQLAKNFKLRPIISAQNFYQLRVLHVIAGESLPTCQPTAHPSTSQLPSDCTLPSTATRSRRRTACGLAEALSKKNAISSVATFCAATCAITCLGYLASGSRQLGKI